MAKLWSLSKDHAPSTKNNRNSRKLCCYLSSKGSWVVVRQVIVNYKYHSCQSSWEVAAKRRHCAYVTSIYKYQTNTNHPNHHKLSLSKSPLLLSFFPGLLPLLCTQPIGMRLFAAELPPWLRQTLLSFCPCLRNKGFNEAFSGDTSKIMMSYSIRGQMKTQLQHPTSGVFRWDENPWRLPNAPQQARFNQPGLTWSMFSILAER